MSTIQTPPPDKQQDENKPLPETEHLTVNYLNETKGIWSWMTTLDHKRIGVMYLFGVVFMFFLGGIFAILLRTELFLGGGDVMTAAGKVFGKGWMKMYNQAFTLHGAIMVFLFIIPAIPAAFGNFVLPVMLGAKDVAFPRLNLMSFYLWCIGAVFFIGAIAAGGLDTGWTFYTPYATGGPAEGSKYSEFGGMIPATFGAFILGFSSILTGMNFIASVHMLRPPTMGWFRMPLLLWALYATAIIQILATPVLAITLLLLIVERLGIVAVFDPSQGGDPVLYQHFFWFYSHPAVYIMILPAMGVISEVISTFSRKHIFGYSFIAMSSMAIALLGFLVWGHHMFTSGQGPYISVIFSFITFFIAVPSAIKVWNWLATMFKGSLLLRTPLIYAMSFIWVFTIGGLTGLPLAALSTDIHLHDTYFVVAHFHYVMVGGTVFAFLAGLHHWWPKMFGKMYQEKPALWAWGFIFGGFNLTFFPQFFMGTQGMPRRYADWSIEAWKGLNLSAEELADIESKLGLFSLCHKASTIGSYGMLVGFLLLAWLLYKSLVAGKPAPRNPWGSNTLEWHTPSPPPHANFDEQPQPGDPYNMTGWKYDPTIEGYTPCEPKPLHH